MPKVQGEPEKLRPYLFHGVVLNWREGDEHAYGDCPFCSRPKFSVRIENGVWRCLVCNEGADSDAALKGGNSYTFIRKLHQLSEEATQTADYKEFAADLGLLMDTLIHWRLCKSIITGNWLIPGYGADGKLNTLYVYSWNGERWMTLPTPGHGHQLHGVNLFHNDRAETFLCEGFKDGMALWETFEFTKATDDGYMRTASQEANMLNQANVLATPSANVFFESWLPLLAGRGFIFVEDNDHEIKDERTGKLREPAAFLGMRAACKMLRKAPPSSVYYVKWGEKLNYYNPDLKHGYDVRDKLGKPDDLNERVKRLAELIGLCQPVPAEWLGSTEDGRPPTSSGTSTGAVLQPIKCESYKQVVQAWKKAMRWTDGLDHALAVMFAQALSTRILGDQLWYKILGPPSCGKSTLCEAMAVARRFVICKSTIRGFHSGYKTDKEGETDNSLLAITKDMFFITKDGDTLLQAPNRDEILAEARDVYDRVSRTHYRHGLSRDYEDHSMPWALAGTSALRALDETELGARFLDCVIMDDIDDELEDEILWRVANRVIRNAAVEIDGKPETRYEPALAEAMQLTGGYVEYLRENATELLSRIDAPETAIRQCTRLGKFVAFMRARPSKKQDEDAQRELASRLVSQHTKTATCLTVVLQRKSLDAEVMRRVTRVAMDTGRGKVLELAKHLYKAGMEGLQMKSIQMHLFIKDDEAHRLLKYLRKIGMVESYAPESQGVRVMPKYRLTHRLQKLYRDVMPQEELV